jgi:hypothetical protein
MPLDAPVTIARFPSMLAMAKTLTSPQPETRRTRLISQAMQPFPGRRDRTVKLVLAGLAMIVLLVVVSFATRSGFGHASASRPTPGYVSWAMSIFLVFFVLMIPVAMYAYSIQARESLAQKERKPYYVRIIRNLAFVLLILGLGLARLFWHGKIHLSWHAPSAPPPPQAGKVLAGHANDTYRPTFQWPVLYVTIALGVLVVVWFWWLRRNAPPAAAAGAELTAAEDVAATISDAIDDLEAEPDARAAVIAAYARMERTFDRRGLERRPSETPIEYLRRILVGLGSRAEPVARLTGLFEQAKFSDHLIDCSMKRDAIDALRAIRSDLQAASA